MKLKSVMVAGLLAFGLASGQVMAGSHGGKADAASFDAAYKAAEEARKKAASVGGEWRDIGKFMKKAKAAAEAKDYGKAMKLAKKVKFQAEAGYKQAMSQKGVGNPKYLK